MCVDKYLSWDSHINHLCSKLSRANGIISKLRHNAPIETCLQVYYAIFYSSLIYGCNIWGLTSKENLDKIVVLQKKCIRIMTFSKFNTHTNQHFIDLGLLKVKDIIKTQQLKITYDFHNNSLPHQVQNLFNYCDNVHGNNLVMNLVSSRKRLLSIPRIKTIYSGQRSLKYHCVKLWNEVLTSGISIDSMADNDISINDIFNVIQFKRVMKKHFLHSYTL